MLRKLARLFLLPFALLAVALIRLLARCGVLIRIGEFWSERVGHLAGNTECYLCERTAGRHPKSFDIWGHRQKVSNKYLAKMIGRVVWVDPTRFINLVRLVNGLFKGWEKHIACGAQLDRDVHGLYAKHPPHLRFTPREEMRGIKQLRKWGIPEGAKWVCLIVRDEAYLPEKHYHSYRDSDVSNYALAAAELAERGYYVFRMGAKVKARLPIKHPRIFDYAVNGMRSEFMDIYLGAKCEFCVSNGTGFDAIPVIFRRPVCFVNYVPVEYLNTWVESVAIWKHHEKDGKRMSFQEIVDSGAGHFMRTKEFLDAGILLKENTQGEIRDAVLETLDMVVNKTPPSKEQEEFKKSFPKSMSQFSGTPLHGDIRMRIGQKFLAQYEQRTRKAVLA